jgi:hypothetical protein
MTSKPEDKELVALGQKEGFVSEKQRPCCHNEGTVLGKYWGQKTCQNSVNVPEMYLLAPVGM